MDSPSNIPETLQGWLTAAGVAAGSFILGWSRMAKNWAADRRDRVASDAATDIVSGLREEVARLQKVNAALADELNRMQLRCAELLGQNLDQTVRLEALQEKIDRMIQLQAGKEDADGDARAEPV